jgi:hypothetical protein
MACRAFWRFGVSGPAGLSPPNSAACGLRGPCTEPGASSRSPSIVSSNRPSNDENHAPKDELKRLSKESWAIAGMGSVVRPSLVGEAGPPVTSMSRLAKRTPGICELVGARYSPISEEIVPTTDAIGRPPGDSRSDEIAGIPPDMDDATVTAEAAIPAINELNPMPGQHPFTWLNSRGPPKRKCSTFTFRRLPVHNPMQLGKPLFSKPIARSPPSIEYVFVACGDDPGERRSMTS